MATQFNLPRQVKINVAGRPYAGAQAFFYQTATEVLQSVYQDAALVTPHPQPISADDDGYFPVIWLDSGADFDYRVVVKSATGVLLDDVNDIQARVFDATSEDISDVLDSLQLTQAETNAGVTPINYAYPPGNALRFLTPNDPQAATANTLALQSLFDPIKEGPRGDFVFPSVTGADTYHFNGVIQIRDGVRLNLGGNTLKFAKTYSSADNYMGFLTFIRDVTIENGAITVDYDGTAGIGNNPGPIMRLGSRFGYKFGTYANGIFDKDDLIDNGLPHMGNITLRKLRLNTSNPKNVCGAAVLLLGGLQNVTIEDIEYIGTNSSTGPGCVIYYEFGFAAKNGFPSTFAQWSSSHATNLVFRNISARNLNTSNPNDDDYVVNLVEAYNVIAENISGNFAYGVFQFRPGEAHFYRPWTANQYGVKRSMTLRNITGQNLIGTGCSLVGSQGAVGYLSDAKMTEAGLTPLTAQQKTDLMRFTLNGFSLQVPGGVGVKMSGTAELRNGTTRDCTHGYHIEGDTEKFLLINCESRNSTDVGVRASDAGDILPARKKSGTFRHCKIVGSTGAGISLDSCDGIDVELCQLGYNTTDDGSSETTQTVGVSVSTAGSFVRCRNNKASTSGGAVGYAAAGTGDRGNSVTTPRGTVTTSGTWLIDGIATASATQLGEDTEAINTVNKYFGKLCIETTNNRLYFALGSGPTDGWRLADGSATVTPT